MKKNLVFLIIVAMLFISTGCESDWENASFKGLDFQVLKKWNNEHSNKYIMYKDNNETKILYEIEITKTSYSDKDVVAGMFGEKDDYLDFDSLVKYKEESLTNALIAKKELYESEEENINGLRAHDIVVLTNGAEIEHTLLIEKASNPYEIRFTYNADSGRKDYELEDVFSDFKERINQVK